MDTRVSLVPGVHACLDVRLVVPLRRHFRRVYAFPPCTHQTRSDTTGRASKELDGRMFWGILFVLYCTTISASMLVVEQPDTVIPDFAIAPTQRLRTGQMGDDIDKPINLYERGRARLQLRRDSGGVSGHGAFSDFANAEERDRERSSWRRYPHTARALVEALPQPDSVVAPSFAEVREQFAVAWYQAGLPVPPDYETEDAQPSDAEARRYQHTRGKGDGRRVQGVVPTSLRRETVTPFDASSVQAQFVALTALSANAFALMFVTMQATPLIFAALNGVEVVGAEFHELAARKLSLTIASRWADRAIGAVSSTFLVGEYKGGARLFVSPLDIMPPRSQVVRTPAERRRRLAAGVAFAWCTVAALAGTVAYDPAARAAAACAALRCPVPHLADAVALSHRHLSSFSIGVFSTRPMVDRLAGLPTRATPAAAALARMAHHALDLQTRLRAEGDDESLFWADVIHPEELQDVPPGFFNALPTFDDARLDQYLLTPPYSPPQLDKLLPRPLQPVPLGGHCPRSPLDLMPPPTQLRFVRWMALMLADLVCIRDHGVECERDRPPILVIAQSELFSWARGVVWDFRAAPEACGIPLDYGAALQPTLRADFFRRELDGYPNQRILGMIETGVIYQADVELHAVFIPHLTSLPKGFKAVAKELKRLAGKGWYEYYPHTPFFPGYYNGQGSTARKLEPDRDRRTTEGGAPRREIFDRDGLRVLSINGASKIYHVPQHYLHDTRPEMIAWLQSRGLPPTQEQIDQLRLMRGTKWGNSQYMPTVRVVMHDIAVLNRVARRLEMPIYIFGNDVKDYFLL